MSRFQRLLLPSIADLLFAGFLFTRIQSTLFYDADTGWHLWAGFATLGEGLGRIPDALSFSQSGVLWANPEWLGSVLLSVAYGHGDYTGVGILCGVVFAATFSWLYRILFRESGDAVAALLVTVLAAQVTLIHFLARPLIFSFPIFLGVLEILRRSPPGRTLWLLPLLTILWANLHPSAYLVPAMALFFWLRGPRSRMAGLSVVLTTLALGVTPWGFGWILDALPGPGNASYLARITEWTAPQFNELRFVPILLALLLALAARRGRPSLTTGELIWGLGWMGASLITARLAPYAILAWSPFLARDLADGALLPKTGWLRRRWLALTGALSPMEGKLSPRLWPILVGALALILAPRLGPVFPQATEGFPADRFPSQALSQAESLNLGPRVFNHYGWGGYISWVSDRRWQVFIDGRLGFFGNKGFQDYLTVFNLRDGWQEVLNRHNPDWLLFPPKAPIVTAAPLTGRWFIVHEDDLAIILVPARP